MLGAFIVAIEYRGADLDRGSGTRPGLLEHAYDLETASLAAHCGEPPRVGFPEPDRGWGSASLCPRCAECKAVVDEVVADYIRTALRRHHGTHGNCQ
ncbi:MAG: hypothetical protein ABIQ09_01920 [Jatrophihabitantaceae bacterium]